MKRDTYYFPHDSNAHNDPKMLALRVQSGFEGIGLYWTIVEVLRDLPDYKYPLSPNYLQELELLLSHPQARLEAWLEQACELGLLVIKDNFLYSESLVRRMAEIDHRRTILIEAGRRGGIKSSQAQACLKHPSSSKVKEIKVKEIKEKSSIYMSFEQDIITKWNSFCDKYPILSKVKELGSTRRQHLKQRFTQTSFKDFNKILSAIETQPFLTSGNPESTNHKHWVISFDWLIVNDINYIKVLEGKYKSNQDTTDKIKEVLGGRGK